MRVDLCGLDLMILQLHSRLYLIAAIIFNLLVLDSYKIFPVNVLLNALRYEEVALKALCVSFCFVTHMDNFIRPI